MQLIRHSSMNSGSNCSMRSPGVPCEITSKGKLVASISIVTARVNFYEDVPPTKMIRFFHLLGLHCDSSSTSNIQPSHPYWLEIEEYVWSRCGMSSRFGGSLALHNARLNLWSGFSRPRTNRCMASFHNFIHPAHYFVLISTLEACIKRHSSSLISIVETACSASLCSIAHG